MILSVTENIEADTRVITLTIGNGEMLRAKTTPLDKALFRDCDMSGKISDKLLALETLARRIEESA